MRRGSVASLVLLLLAPPGSAQDEVLLPAADGWRAALVYESDVGIWTTGSLDCFPLFGCPEVFGLDDRGRCTILTGYSGKWTPNQTVEDGGWLGAFAWLDLDPRRPGNEIYTGGRDGNLFQLVPHDEVDFDTAVIARFPARELHTMVGGELLPTNRGNELLCFSGMGDVYEILPRADGIGFDARTLTNLGGRVREALVLPHEPGATPDIAAVTRSGEVMLLRMTDGGLEHRTIVREPMGFGRVALRPGAAAGKPLVLYATRDDGVVLRLEGSPATSEPWKREIVYAGPQGPRGIAAGRFSSDPDVESFVVFGYSAKVQMVSRKGTGPWHVETIFADRDKGHWLATAELDGRNTTDEILASGYGKRIVLLSRVPGYGLPGVATDPSDGKAARIADADRPVRVLVRASRPGLEKLDPLSYRGGFETKTLVYETLVRRDSEGRIVPGLASSWRFEDGGRTVVFTLRDGACFHDGRPADAESVRQYFQRWVNLPEHSWLRCSSRIRAVTAPMPRELRITMDQPCALLPDLCAINPCAVRGAGALDNEGTFVWPVGTGPSAFVDVVEGALRYRDVATGALVDLVPFDGNDPNGPVDALLQGRADVIADGWTDMVPRERVAELARDPALRLEQASGSAVVYLSFRLDDGPTANAAVRHAIAGAVVRDELIRSIEHGHADPCFGWAAPTVKVWPACTGPAHAQSTSVPAGTALRVITDVGGRYEKIGRALVQQLERAGFAASVAAHAPDAYVAALANGEYDVRIEQTWGVPYDPDISLAARFLPPPATPNAATPRFHGVDPRLVELVEGATREPDADRRAAVYAEIQTLMDREALIVPLYVPRRLAVMRADVEGLALDHDLYRLNAAALRKRK